MSRQGKPRHSPEMAKRVEALIAKRASRYEQGLPLWDADEPGAAHNSDYVREVEDRVEVRAMTQAEQALFGVKRGVK